MVPKISEAKPPEEVEDTSITFKTVKALARKFNLPNKDVYELGKQIFIRLV